MGPFESDETIVRTLLNEHWLLANPSFLPGDEAAVRSLVAWCCLQNRVPTVMAKRIAIRWSNRMTRAAGKATSRGEIVLSAPLSHAVSYAERRNTIIHEACHHIAGLSDGHGFRWKAAMVRCGERPERLYPAGAVDWSKVPARRRPRRYPYACGCRHWALSAVRHRRIERGAEYRCPSCKGRLEPQKGAQAVQCR